MPKATVHKNGQLELLKDEIRIAKERWVTPPACKFVSSQDIQKRKFGPFVSLATHASHDGGTFRFRENISHL